MAKGPDPVKTGRVSPARYRAPGRMTGGRASSQRGWGQLSTSVMRSRKRADRNGRSASPRNLDASTRGNGGQWYGSSVRPYREDGRAIPSIHSAQKIQPPNCPPFPRRCPAGRPGRAAWAGAMVPMVRMVRRKTAPCEPSNHPANWSPAASPARASPWSAGAPRRTRPAPRQDALRGLDGPAPGERLSLPSWAFQRAGRPGWQIESLHRHQTPWRGCPGGAALGPDGSAKSRAVRTIRTIRFRKLSANGPQGSDGATVMRPIRVFLSSGWSSAWSS